jgi:hypothetical protein
MLRDLHGVMQRRDGPPTFVFAATNSGTRPANDALIIIKARGRFEIMPPPYRPRDDAEHDDLAVKKESPVELPRPPSAPGGTWKTRLSPQFEAFERYAEFQRAFGQSEFNAEFQRAFGHSEFIMPQLRDISPHVPKPRDPNAFFYKPDRPSLPGPEFALECKQWRHGLEAVTFVGQIHLVNEAKEISGALECSVHAGNLSDAASKLIPVRIKVTHVKTNEVAAKLINQLRS